MQIKGIGSPQTSGEYMFSFGILMPQANIALPGTLDSNEILGAETSMLLSQNAQDQLLVGIIKDMRRGTIRLSGS